MNSKQSNRLLWAIQIVLAVIFSVTGAGKILLSKSAIGDAGIAYAQHFPALLIKLIGVCELLAVAGLVLPGAIHRFKRITALAAAGLCCIMVGAIITHALLGEWALAIGCVVLFGLAGIVAVGRQRSTPLW